ncbi:MAG: transcription termination/antitermination protein NusG [Thermodesulfobacteriota bacterium]
MEEWFAVYSRVRHEKAVLKEIQKKNFETYLPLMEQISHWKDRKKKVYLPLFPGYLFVKINPKNSLEILKVPGVIRILGSNGKLIPVPSSQIDGIKELLNSGLHYEISSKYVSGKEVEVIKGPLSGTTGKIINLKGNYKLILSVDIINRSILVEIDIDHVEIV